MKKLLQLLNEYKEGKPFQFTGYDEEYGIFETNLNMNGNTSLPAETIVCKKFGFIQWLVLNLKVDTDKLMKHGYIVKTYDLDELGGNYSYVDSLLMLLAIQENPISFLVSTLK